MDRAGYAGGCFADDIVLCDFRFSIHQRHMGRGDRFYTDLCFGAAVFGLLKMGVGAVDEGQYDAAYALGYSNSRTFFRIILPQAIPHVVDAYKGEIVSLLKGTAIVGYIAVQDLTKMGDIVRSRTYEAFFPLIAVTIIYFLLEMLLGSFVKRIRIHIDPKQRSRKAILKGVNTDDQN